MEGLDLIQECDQITHLVSLDNELGGENTISINYKCFVIVIIDVFKSDSLNNLG